MVSEHQVCMLTSFKCKWLIVAMPRSVKIAKAASLSLLLLTLTQVISAISCAD